MIVPTAIKVSSRAIVQTYLESDLINVSSYSSDESLMK